MKKILLIAAFTVLPCAAAEVAVVENVQIIYEIADGKGGVFRDAMNMTKQEYAASTAKSRAVEQAKRLETWKASVAEAVTQEEKSVEDVKEEIVPCKE